MNRTGALVSANTPKILMICDRPDTASVWGYTIRKGGLAAVIESSMEKALERMHMETPDLIVLDTSAALQDPMEFCGKFRAISVNPILLLLPSHHEDRILEAYAAGIDEVIIKPVSPPIFLAKVLAWLRRSWTISVDGLDLVKVGSHRLDPKRRGLIDPDGREIKLTNLEYRLLHLLMNHPRQVFSAEDIVESIWGRYGTGDQVLLKNVVYRLRKKIEADPARPLLLQTWPGGYCFYG